MILRVRRNFFEITTFPNSSNNDDHHTFIYLQLNITTRYLEQRYDSIWMPPAVYRDVQWSSVAMPSKKWTRHENIMLAILRSCKAIWQWMLKSCIWWWWKLHGNISRNGYGNAMIGRYGGCFEEDIRRLCVIERIVSRGLDAPAKFAPTLEVRKGNARYRRG